MTAPDYAWLYARTRSGRARGAAGVQLLLAQLGHPERALACIRVVGTNGKGSTAAMLAAGLGAAGVGPVGLFTSPHLTHYEERIVIGGQQLDPARTAAFVAWAQQHAPDAAFFDLTLALACLSMAQAGVRWAVMEAGVGGRSDATEALPDVRAVALTSIGADHLATLGPTRADVARDKAGAARSGVPLLSTAEDEEDTVAQVAAEAEAPLDTPRSSPDLFALPRLPRLAGPHQARNAALALATLRTLGFGGPAVLEAALDADWPARLERRLLNGREVLLDGAHNPPAAAALALAVGHADVLLFGNMARKDTAATLEPLRAVCRTVIYTAPCPDPQALARQYGGQAILDTAEALATALARTPPGGRLLVAGSLYLAGEVRVLLSQA
jgi:dihydrofolate synthase / folylpolyglutamate synthase